MGVDTTVNTAANPDSFYEEIRKFNNINIVIESPLLKHAKCVVNWELTPGVSNVFEPRILSKKCLVSLNQIWMPIRNAQNDVLTYSVMSNCCISDKPTATFATNPMLSTFTLSIHNNDGEDVCNYLLDEDNNQLATAENLISTSINYTLIKTLVKTGN